MKTELWFKIIMGMAMFIIVASVFFTIWGILLLGHEIEQGGGLGSSIGKFINSIQKEIK